MDGTRAWKTTPFRCFQRCQQQSRTKASGEAPPTAARTSKTCRELTDAAAVVASTPTER